MPTLDNSYKKIPTQKLSHCHRFCFYRKLYYETIVRNNMKNMYNFN